MSADDGYPDTAQGVTLHKSTGAGSGYKGVTLVKLPTSGFRARDGSRILGMLHIFSCTKSACNSPCLAVWL
jgi:hypothetical protein